ncbi:DUF72 domain-containing protein [Amaricoccus sp.]|uniref:DUF72 domain-containing protein n=1 Tax=Amaricoccus sp. TaxID=1872485 RepID=UPI001B437F73|nr:DUF72 domain-containing protein [Amaricoccus sp.]MBP7001262.1 DUF72 domain-containing protein [Amaricoccus sp.]
MAGRIRIGVGGWTFEPWRKTFFPEKLPQKRELEYMAGKLSSIEINGTFYRTQKPATFAKWRAETPEGFVFALKGPRYATNRSALGEAGESVGWFIDSGIAELGDRLGPINWQLATTKKYDRDEMAAFLDLLPEKAGERKLRHAVEARHPSFADGFGEQARERGVAVVLAGDSEYPVIEGGTEDFVYARIMGTTEGHEAGYSEAALDGWAARAKGWAAAGRDVYLYVISGHKAANPAAALALIARTGG